MDIFTALTVSNPAGQGSQPPQSGMSDS